MRSLVVFSFLLLTCFSLATISFAAQQESGRSVQSAQLYERLEKAVFQIRVIDKSSGEKSTIGSGFSISADRKFITNYHVVSKVIKTPERYKIEYLHEDGRSGALRILAIDVVNDLALLQGDEDISFHLTISENREVQKGTHVFSMGNPHDLGMMIIEGVFNGFFENTFYEKILFSGTLNPGMSGGPSLNEKGHVIGVNVAKKGDDIGYLVPAKFISDLVSASTAVEIPSEDDWNRIIEEQLQANQKRIFDGIFNAEWDAQTLGDVAFPKNISSALKCWGDGHAEDNDRHHSHSWITCESEDTIYLSSSFYTGRVSYYVETFESTRLGQRGFAEYYTERFGNPSLYGGYREENDAPEFTCKNRFVRLSEQPWKIAFCTRSYKNMPSLHDTYMAMARLSDEKIGYIIEVDLQGVTQDNAMQFYKRFLGYVDQ
ncbi:MAG: S1 family peptidase [Alphaproteobacteria bacterium]